MDFDYKNIIKLKNKRIKELLKRIDKAEKYIKKDMYVEPKELYGLIDGEHLLNILEEVEEEEGE